MRIYIKDGALSEMKKFLTQDDALLKKFKLQIDGDSGEYYMDCYNDPFCPTFAMILFPPPLIDRYTERNIHIDNEACFRTEGLYRLEGVDNTELRCWMNIVHGHHETLGDYDRARMIVEVSAPDIGSLQRLYDEFRQGKLKSCRAGACPAAWRGSQKEEKPPGFVGFY